MNALAAFVRDRLGYQYVFGTLTWLILLGQLVANRGIYEPNGLLFGIDYLAFYSAGQMVLTGRSAELYDPAALGDVQRELYEAKADSIMPFLNPPFFAWLLAPFAALPFIPSLLAWTAFSLGFLCLGLLGLESPLRKQTVASVLCFFPILYAIRNGQNSLLTAGLFGMVFGCLRRDRPFLAGLTASLIVYKPHLLLGLGILWLAGGRRGWLALAGLACGGAVLLISTWLFMPEALAQYLELSRTKLANFLYRPGYEPKIQYTVRGLVLTLLPGQRWLAETSQYLVLTIGGLAIFIFSRRQPDLSRRFALALAIGACIAPYLLLYDWAVLVVPAILLWRNAPEQRDDWAVPFTAVWLIAYLGRPLVELQLRYAPVALHLPYLVLVVATVVVWRQAVAVRAEAIQPSS